MFNWVYKKLRVLLIVMMMFTAPAHALEDAIIAIVNDEVVTLKDLREYMNGIYSQLRLEGKDPFEVDEIMRSYEEQGIEKLIDDRLILSRANEVGLQIRKSAVDRRLEEIKSQYKSDQEFWAALQEEGLSVSDVRRKVEDQFKAQFIVEQEVKDKIFVNPQEITQFYEQNPEYFKKDDAVQLDSIFLTFEQGEAVARQKAEEAMKALNNGDEFERVAAQYSDAPSVGVVERGQLMSQVEEVVFNLKQDEVSGVVEVENGLFIFKLLGREEGEEVHLLAVKERIHDRVFQEKFKKAFKEWIEELRDEAYVEIK